MSEPALEGFPTGYFTPAYKLLKETYSDCVKALEPIIARKNNQEFIELVTGGIIDFWTLDNIYAGRGRKYKRTIVDEAAFFHNLEKSWNEAIRPTLTDLKGDAFFFSTPRGRNDFYTLFDKKNYDQNWNSWQRSTYANPFIDPNEIEEARKGMPEAAFRQEYLAEFAENAANPFKNIEQCILPLSTEAPVCFGIDLAKSVDYTAIIGLDRFGVVCYFDHFQKPWPETLKEIERLPNLPTQIDSTGVGDPIVDQLQRVKPNITGFKFNPMSKQQIMEGLVMAIAQRKVNYPEGLITNELKNFGYEYSKFGVKYKAVKGHDDCVCALALAWDIHKTTQLSGSYSWV